MVKYNPELAIIYTDKLKPERLFELLEYRLLCAVKRKVQNIKLVGITENDK